MVATGLFSDAQAFLADAAPAFSGSAAAAARAASVLADLRISRKAAGTLAVPFLSSDVITQAAGNSLAALQSIEAEIATAVQQGTTVAGAKAGLQGTLAMMDQVSAAATTEVQGDIAHVAELQKAFDAMNATYQQRYGDMGAAQATFKAGVQAALSAEIAEIVVEFIVDIATAVATEGAGAASMFSQLGGKISELTNVIKDVEKFAQLINTVAQMIYNLDSLINQLIPLVNQIEALPSAPNINLPPDAVAQASNSTNLASLTQSALSFQDLHDQATIYLGPAINQGIGGASDYAAALAGLANAGLDMVNLQIQLLGAQNKLVQSGVKLQSAIDQKARITSLINAIEADEQAVAAAVMELSLTQLERKMRAVDLVYQACAAFEYAHNAPCPAAANMPDPSSPAADFANAVRDALTGLDSVFQVSQCMCNVSWITTEPSFIGNLSANGRATLDLTNLSDDLLNYYFASTWDNVHTFQINLKPYGIKPSGFTPPGAIPTLQLLISPSGEYLNTFTQGGTRYVRPFLATPYTFAMAAQPSNGWKVTVPGGLTDDGAARFYVPTPYSRFDVRGDPNQPQDWDWTGVWGVQVEIWGYATHSSAGQNTGSGPICSSCSSASQAAMKAIGAR
ncbi:hypothetical protein DFJ74DRAFT_660306 [Hyaloraphidium curvatum]|nr:hypothetical protein DFJ74DRAFT_660306 [Hyaloraphidium curvatum]